MSRGPPDHAEGNGPPEHAAVGRDDDGRINVGKKQSLGDEVAELRERVAELEQRLDKQS